MKSRLLVPTLSLILLTVIPLYLLHISPSPNWLSFRFRFRFINKGKEYCNLFHGKWVPNPKPPYYTNATCSLIFDQQNCIKFGRPDNEYLKWRWQPDKCKLPIFDAVRFLDTVRGKSMAFVGDSVGRNHVQSLLCLLATVVYPSDVSNSEDQNFRLWLYKDYNFTLAAFWSPYLVKAVNTHPTGPIYDRLVNIYLDEANNVWSDKIESFDYVIISAGQWFFGPQIFYENHQIVGCHKCPTGYNITRLSMFYGHGKAFATSFQTLLNLRNFAGVVILRTWSPSHFENGEWNSGGNCARKRPMKRGEIKLKGDNLKLYESQVKEWRKAATEGRKKGLKFRIMDTTEAMVVRADGHPNHYGHWAHENVSMADCVHWCLPGPIDTWNELLLQMLQTGI